MRKAWNQPKCLNRCSNCFVVAWFVFKRVKMMKGKAERRKEEGKERGKRKIKLKGM